MLNQQSYDLPLILSVTRLDFSETARYLQSETPAPLAPMKVSKHTYAALGTARDGSVLIGS